MAVIRDNHVPVVLSTKLTCSNVKIILLLETACEICSYISSSSIPGHYVKYVIQSQDILHGGSV